MYGEPQPYGGYGGHHPPPSHQPPPPPPPHYGGGGGGGGFSGGNNPNADRTVFIGNLPWDTTSEQLGAHCSMAGPVTHVRLVTDHHTGQGKGFAFVEYRDVASATAAIGHLQGMEFRGRPLRFDFSDPAHRGKKEMLAAAAAAAAAGGPLPGRAPFPPPQDRAGEDLRKVFSSSGPTPSDMHPSDVRAQQQPGGSPAAPAAPAAPTSIPITVGSLAPPIQPGAAPYGTDTIAKLVTSLTKAQLLEILSEMKKFAAANPDGARQLLFDSPQVASTLLHILIMFGLVRPNDVANIQTMQRPVAGSLPTMALPGMAPMPPAAMPLPPPPMPAAAGYPLPPPPMPLPSPPMAAPVAAAPAPAAAAFTEQDAFMLKEIMKLQPEQIRQLPQEVQDKIQLLQQQLQAQAR